jgi:ribosome-associated translation inhibitor RaiA
MHVDIQSLGFNLTPALSAHTRKRIDDTLHFASSRITRMLVRLSDINGRRGGNDKRCLVELRVKGVPNVVIEDVETDLYSAIDRAIGRARLAMLRRLGHARGAYRHRKSLVGSNETA